MIDCGVLEIVIILHQHAAILIW